MWNKLKTVYVSPERQIPGQNTPQMGCHWQVRPGYSHGFLSMLILSTKMMTKQVHQQPFLVVLRWFTKRMTGNSLQATFSRSFVHAITYSKKIPLSYVSQNITLQCATLSLFVFQRPCSVSLAISWLTEGRVADPDPQPLRYTEFTSSTALPQTTT